MSIKRMLLLASMALAATAFAVPAMAQADVTLTDPENQPLANGAKVTATSENLVTTTGSGTLECSLVTLHLEVKTNNNKHVVIEQLGEATTEGCVLNAGEAGTFPTTITDGTLGVGGGEKRLTIDTWGTGETNATFVSHSYLEGFPHEEAFQIATCHFTGPVHVLATDGTDIIHVNGELAKTPGEESCPSETGNLHGEFTLETPNGTTVIIDAVNTG